MAEKIASLLAKSPSEYMNFTEPLENLKMPKQLLLLKKNLVFCFFFVIIFLYVAH